MEGRSVYVGGVEALVLHGCSDHGDGRRDAQYSQHQHRQLPHDHCWATTEPLSQRRPFIYCSKLLLPGHVRRSYRMMPRPRAPHMALPRFSPLS